MAVSSRILLVTFLCTLLVTSSIAQNKKEEEEEEEDEPIEVDKKVNQAVVYDRRSVVVNGKRELFFSGSIHYPRSTPDVCIWF